LLKLFIYSVFLTIIGACSLIDKIAIKTTGSVITSGSDELLTESNWFYFEKAVPANLKMMEGLWFSDQSNKEILSSLVKGFGAHAFAINETKSLKDIIEDNSESFEITQTILYYEKAIFYGFKYLEESGITQDEFMDKSFSFSLKKKFDETFDEDDHIAILYFAQSLGSSINLQRENVSKLGYFNHVKAMLNWVCSANPNIERGSCKLFDAVIEASTSGVLGGKMEIAKKKFKQVMLDQPYNLLAKLSYVQYYVVPMLEEDEFSVLMESLGKDLNIWQNLQMGNSSKRSVIYEKNREFNLFNSIANERYKTLLKMRKLIFD
jgi:hypothetical protein